MNQLYEAARIISSNLVYPYLIKELKKLLPVSDMLLLTAQGDDLVVVEVAGQLPASLVLPACRKSLENWQPGQPLSQIDPTLAPYQQVLSFRNEQGSCVGFLVLAADYYIEVTPELDAFTRQAASLLDLNHSITHIASWQDTQSKLMYQLSFFINTVTNIFEPYDYLTMIKLYMEIISEMFLFSSTVVYELKEHHYIPIASRGINTAQLDQLVLEAHPILSHPTLGYFPQKMADLTPAQLGTANYQILKTNNTNLLIPLQVTAQPRYLMAFQCHEDKCRDSQDWRIISALAQTFNRAIELNEIRQELMLTNQALDKQIFSLTTIYQAADKILTIADPKQTAEMALDMLMEIFQSVVSSVFIHNADEERLELQIYKSVLGHRDLSYWLTVTELPSQLVIDYSNPEERSDFLRYFSNFSEVENYLQPKVIIHLRQQNRYYGFITLSSRMIEQPYTPEDFALLSMLSHSIAIALDNAWMLVRIKEQNYLLDQQLEELMAIQDALRIMRQAATLPELCNLMAETLRISIGASLMALIISDAGQLRVITGPEQLAVTLADQLPRLTNTATLTIEDNQRILVVPVLHPGRLTAYLIINEFANTILDDGRRIHLLDMVAAMLADTLAHLYERYCITTRGVLDYSQLLCRCLQQEQNQLTELGLSTCLVKFYHPDPAEVITSLGYAAYGVIIQPQTAVLLGRVPVNELVNQLAAYTNQYLIIPDLTPEAIFADQIPQ